MDYTREQNSIMGVETSQPVFQKREQFNNYLSDNNVEIFTIISEHSLSSNGNGCLNKLKRENNFECILDDENSVKLRSTKITINYSLNCILNF